MKWPSLNTIILVIAVIFITLQIRSWFAKPTPDAKIIELDQKNKDLEKQRLIDSVDLKQARWEKDSVISVSNERLNNLANQKQQIINVIKKVPVIVDNFDREQLHSGAESY